MEKTITMADVCELAHTLTVEVCMKQYTEVDTVSENGDTIYTTQAQAIFDRYYDTITNSLNI